MSNKTRILSALAIAVGMLMLSYWVTNLSLAISGETALIRKVELLRGWFKPHVNPLADSVLLINVAYDKEIIIAKDKKGKEVGYGGIVDRQKLHQLLSELKNKDDSLYNEEHQHFYKYILLDVLFIDDVHTSQDSALFKLIASMDRIAIARDINSRMADTCLIAKAGLVNYDTDYKFVSFTKYPYLKKGKKSLPLKMYEEMTGHTITDHCLFANDGWRLARRSIIPLFVLRCDSSYTQEGYKVWYNMGMDLLGSTYTYNDTTIKGKVQLYDNPALFKGKYKDKYQGKYRGKYIVIGAFSGGDMHYSYMESQAGPVILFNAYLSLLHGHHMVSLWLFLLLLLVFFIMAYLILNDLTIEVLLSKLPTPKNPVFAFFKRYFFIFVSWIGYSLLLSILCIFTYLAMGEVYDIFITATAFQLISMVAAKVKYKNKKSHA